MINWNVDPVIFSIGSYGLHWYSLFFLLGFSYGYRFMKKRYAEANLDSTKLDGLLVSMVVGTIIGARLGHTLFYEPETYLAHPLNILKVWEGGLASHGGAVGILVALYIYTRRNRDINMLWLLDRIVVPLALAACFIRLGNLMNSEIVGRPTDLPWAVVFKRIDDIPRHPTPIYEAGSYLIFFGILTYSFFKTKLVEKRGRIFGLFLVLIFGSRILVEFLKEHQVSFEAQLPLDMGQLLSIPFVLLGIYFLVRPQSTRPPFVST